MTVMDFEYHKKTSFCLVEWRIITIFWKICEGVCSNMPLVEKTEKGFWCGFFLVQSYNKNAISRLYLGLKIGFYFRCFGFMFQHFQLTRAPVTSYFQNKIWTTSLLNNDITSSGTLLLSLYGPHKEVWGNCWLILITFTRIFNAVNHYHGKVFAAEKKI